MDRCEKKKKKKTEAIGNDVSITEATILGKQS